MHLVVYYPYKQKHKKKTHTHTQGYYKRNRHFQCCIETKFTWFCSTCF